MSNTVLRTDIERALDELASQEEGMRFQGLAVILGKKRWPELIARQRKKDFGLDAYAPAALTHEKIGKGLAASITATLKKISGDAEDAKKNFEDLKEIIFVTSAKVGNSPRKEWESVIQEKYDLQLHIIEREEIIIQMMMPENASLRASFLNINIESEPDISELISKTKRAADVITRVWAEKTKGQPLIDLMAVRIEDNGAESDDILHLADINRELSSSRRLILEGPAGRGKTTTLIQLAQFSREVGTPFVIELPAWASSNQGILDYIAGRPDFQAEGITASDLARVQQTEPFLLLLNGWNEIAESNSTQADYALKELERDFPSAGIIVASRAHHLKPPLPGATRLRLQRLRHWQRSAYLETRLGAKSHALRSLLDANLSLDELTRTPFILSEVASLFDAEVAIPSTKLDILTEILKLHEQRDEHRNALNLIPLSGKQTDYLKALAIKMTSLGTVTLSDAEARAVVAVVTQKLKEFGQVDQSEPAIILVALVAHHVLERLDYPQIAFQFEHQQLQEFYAAIYIKEHLFSLEENELVAINAFNTEYINDPIWDEPLRMIAESIGIQTENSEINNRNIKAGEKLVLMALKVDLVFASELAQLCGIHVWNKVRKFVGERLRVAYMLPNNNYRECALAAMIATGADDFMDITKPLLAGPDQQKRLSTYRLWPNIHISSFGPNWRKELECWSAEAKTDFVSELLHHRIDKEIIAFAAMDDNMAVKKAAVSGLIWNGSNESLAQILNSMNTHSFEDVAREYTNRMPKEFNSRMIAVLKEFINNTSNREARLQTAMNLVGLGETDMDEIIKDNIVAFSKDDMRNSNLHFIKSVLNYLLQSDPVWTRKWVATQIADGILNDYEFWSALATPIPRDLVDKYIFRIETEYFKGQQIEGMLALIAAGADSRIAKRIFTKLRELRAKADAQSNENHELVWQLIKQLDAVFRRIPSDFAAEGVLSAVTVGNPPDIKLAADLFSKVARSALEPLSIIDKQLKMRLRKFLKDSVDVIIREDDCYGKEKADLASSIAQVGMPEDMEDLLKLIHADIQRMRRGKAARQSGVRGSISNGAITSYAQWHIEAAMQLDLIGAEKILIELILQPEYLEDAARAMTCMFSTKTNERSNQAICYNLIWAGREGRKTTSGDESLRIRFAATLNAEIKCRQEEKQTLGLKKLALALAKIDGSDSAKTIIEVLAIPNKWDHYTDLYIAERLLIAGVALPTTVVFALVDSFLESTRNWMQDSDRYLLQRILVLCPFVDNPPEGVAKMRDVLVQRKLQAYELREIITALGQSRSDSATELLYEYISNKEAFKRCEDNFINAFASLDTQFESDHLISLVDPALRGIVLPERPHYKDNLAIQLAELAKRNPKANVKLKELCKSAVLPEPNRQVLSIVMSMLGTPEALTANLDLIDDTKHKPVPQGFWQFLEDSFVERRPYKQDANWYTEHSRASNELRLRLFNMVFNDKKRQKSAFMILGQIERWRLSHGRPTDEPRHPNLKSDNPWPPEKP